MLTVTKYNIITKYYKRAETCPLKQAACLTEITLTSIVNIVFIYGNIMLEKSQPP